MAFFRTALIAALFPAAAMAAEGFTAADLGSVPDDNTCLTRAQQMFFGFGEQFGDVGKVVGQSWTTSAFDITAPEFDAQVICTFGPEDRTRATLVVYSGEGTDDERRNEIASQMKAVWQAL